MNKFIRGRAIIYLALIFIGGAVTGAVIATSVAKYNLLLPPRPDKLTEEMVKRLKSRIGLTDDEVTKIRPILEETGRQLELVRTDTMQRCDKLMVNANARMAGYLTPEQKEKLMDMDAERRKFISSFPSQGLPPGPPPSGPYPPN